MGGFPLKGVLCQCSVMVFLIAMLLSGSSAKLCVTLYGINSLLKSTIHFTRGVIPVFLCYVHLHTG